MDLKKYAGKHVCMQLKGGEQWFVTVAKTTGVEVLAIDTGNGKPQPVAYPFIVGKVLQDGGMEVETGQGGVVAVEFNPEVIHSVSVMTKEPEEPSRLVSLPSQN